MRKIHALILSLAMVFAMSTTAFAAEVPTVGTGTETQGATVSITKDLVMAEGIAIPNATFQFEITAVTAGAPTARIASITYPAESTQSVHTTENGLLTATQTAAIEFGTFSHAGVYEYTVKETPDTYTGAGAMAYSADEYLLRVYVANKADGSVYIQTITAEKDGAKQANVLFTNTYTKDASLTITKNTKGTLANKEQNFDFTIRFTNAATSTATEFVGQIDGTELRCPVGQEVSFQLHDGQSLTFASLPAGTRYVVTEVGAEDGYTPSVQVIENGQSAQEKTAANEGDSISSLLKNPAGTLVGENTNQVTFVNTYHEIAITGIVMNNLPFILLIGAGVVALTALSVLKRKKSH